MTLTAASARGRTRSSLPGNAGPVPVDGKASGFHKHGTLSTPWPHRATADSFSRSRVRQTRFASAAAEPISGSRGRTGHVNPARLLQRWWTCTEQSLLSQGCVCSLFRRGMGGGASCRCAGLLWSWEEVRGRVCSVSTGGHGVAFAAAPQRSHRSPACMSTDPRKDSER